MQQTQDTQGGTYQNLQGTPMPQRMGAENSDDEMTIDLAELFGVLWHWIWLILLVAAVFGAAAFSFSKFVLPEEFQSTTKIYVLDKENGSGQTTYTDLQVGSQLTKDYAELITSRTVIEKVLSDNHLESTYDYTTFLGKVTVDTPTDTRIVSITVTDHDPALAQKLADDIRVEASDLIINTMQIDAVNTYEEANLPTKKSGPSCSKWTALGALLGALLVSAIVVLQYLLDDTVKTSEDVEQYLGLSTLALIPLDENVGGGDRSSKKNKKKKKRQEPEPAERRSKTRAPQERENAMRREPDSYPDHNELAGQKEEPVRKPQPRRDLQQEASQKRAGRGPQETSQGKTGRGSQEAPQGRNGRGQQARPAGKPERTMQASFEQQEEPERRRFGQAPQQKPQARKTQKASVQPAEDEYDDMDVEDFLNDEELHESDFDYGMDDMASDERDERGDE